MGQTVFTLGYPRADLVFGEGSISALTGYNDDTASYQISVPLNPGNSGGPLFDQYGNIVGIISGKQSRTDAAAFAIKSNYVLEMINKVEPGALNFQVSKKYRVNLARMGRVQQIETLKPYIFEVRVIN
nr:trypsin-like peptidase domain-containing protein [Bacteroidota bacterium]